MRLKQLLGILLVPLVLTAMAAAAGTQLTQVGITSVRNASTIMLRATGPFTHTEYRPTDNLLLVDMSGVSAAKMDVKTHLVHAPGVVSYRVLEYKSSDGAPVARVELALASGSAVNLSEASNGLDLHVAPPASISASESQPAPAQSGANSVSAPHPNGAAAASVRVEHVGVVRSKDGVALKIVSSGDIKPATMTLTGPDRLVLDLPNTILPRKIASLAVNSAAIKDVRVARYQSNPPVTRVVVDLARAQAFDITPKDKQFLVTFHDPVSTTPAAALAPATTVDAKAQPAQNSNVVAKAATASDVKPVASAAPAPTPIAAPAKDFAVVTPQLHSVANADKPEVEAASAASHFASTETSFDLSSSPSASMRPMAADLTLPQTATASSSAYSHSKYTGEPISVNLKDVDLKDFFRLIHEISGLNIVLDPNVHGTLTLVLDDVPWDQALDIVLKNNGLDRQLEGNVLRIATLDTLKKEADARRAQVEAQALAVDKVTVTRFLSYAHAKDVVPTVKKFLSSRGDVVSDDRTNSLIINDIPNVIPEIDDLLAKLDRKTPEVEIEARIVAATRNFSRDIGTQLGLGWGINGNSVLGGNSDAGHSNTGVNFPLPAGAPSGSTGVNYPTVTSGSSGPTVPLFSNLGAVPATSGATFVNATRNFRLDFQLSMAESRGLLKILSRPRVVTQNNIQAVVRQGLKIPIVTQAQLGGPPTVTYVDAFLRLSVTPQITAQNTIFLNVDVENTTPDFSRVVQGNPVLNTEQATTQVLVTDGGTVVIGGVIQTTNNVTVAQVPLLGSIPVLGYLFKRNTVSTQTQELIFFITPRIIQT